MILIKNGVSEPNLKKTHAFENHLKTYTDGICYQKVISIISPCIIKNCIILILLNVKLITKMCNLSSCIPTCV